MRCRAFIKTAQATGALSSDFKQILLVNTAAAALQKRVSISILATLLGFCAGGLSATEPPSVSSPPDDPGETAWLALEKARKTPRERLPQLPDRMYTQEEIRAYYGRLAACSAAVADQAAEFLKEFPESKHANDASELYFLLLQSAVALGNTDRVAELEKATAARVRAARLEADKFQLAQQLLHCTVSGRQYESDEAMRAELHRRAHQLAVDFPDRREGVDHLLKLAENYSGDRCVSIAREALEMARDPAVRTDCQGLINRAEAVGKPLTFPLPTTGESTLNLEKEKGKVLVLLFWDSNSRFSNKALWAVDQLYQKYKTEGLSAIGVNLDTDGAKARTSLADAQVEWPQYFDGAEGGAIQKHFGLRTLPACWIVDKRGILRDLKAEKNPEGIAQQLLAEK